MTHRGEIYYISRSGYTTGSEQEAGRPAVIVSNDNNNANAETVEVVYLTTQPKKEMPTHVVIYATGTPSTVLAEQVTTVSLTRVGDKMGVCSSSELEKIDRAITISLGLRQGKSDEAIRAERDVYKANYENLLAMVMGGRT